MKKLFFMSLALGLMLTAIAFADDTLGTPQVYGELGKCMGSAPVGNPDSTLSSTLWTFGVPSGTGEIWATISLRNPGTEDTTISVEVYDSTENLLDTISLALSAGDTATIKTANIKGTLPVNAAKIKATSDQPIFGQEAAGTVHGNWSTTVEGAPHQQTSCMESKGILSSGTSSCCGYSSSKNPYACCSKGNCTWWAWKEAKDKWNESLPGCGNAGTWKSCLKGKGYPWKSKPSSKTIAINSWVGNTGHVAWVESVSGSTVNVSEMGCGYNWCKRTHSYPSSWFDNGYIYKK